MKKIILSGFLSLMATTGLTSVAEATTCSISGSIDFAYTGAIETCTVSQAGLYGVTAVGGGGGNNYVADAQGDISLSSGEVISIIVGGGVVYGGYSYYSGAGGSFVFQGSGSGATPLIVAGGGGGEGYTYLGANASVTTSGTAGTGTGTGGGGGVNGGNGVNSYGQGGEGYLAIMATPTPAGGVFGGGGAGYASAYGSGGGGGGYSGGGGGYYNNSGGGGGGSFVISTATNASIASNPNSNYSSSGTVDFALINATASSPPSSVPEPGAIAVFASAIAGLVFARLWLKKRKT